MSQRYLDATSGRKARSTNASQYLSNDVELHLDKKIVDVQPGITRACDEGGYGRLQLHHNCARMEERYS